MVPKPDPPATPPFRPYTVPSVIDLRTCNAVRFGNSDRISAATPAAIALAAVVLLSVRKPDALAATTSWPAAVSVTYGWRVLNGALTKLGPNAPTAITP